MDQATANAWLGIDVAKEKVDSVLLVDLPQYLSGLCQTPAGFEHLSEWLRQEHVQRLHACLEATGSYSDAVALNLLEQGHLVSVLNPAVLVAYRQSH